MYAGAGSETIKHFLNDYKSVRFNTVLIDEAAQCTSSLYIFIYKYFQIYIHNTYINEHITLCNMLDAIYLVYMDTRVYAVYITYLILTYIYIYAYACI